jgi:hypothetical protein
VGFPSYTLLISHVIFFCRATVFFILLQEIPFVQAEKGSTLMCEEFDFQVDKNVKKDSTDSTLKGHAFHKTKVKNDVECDKLCLFVHQLQRSWCLWRL